MAEPQRLEVLIEAKRLEIRSAMRQLGRAIQNGDDRELVYWIIPGVLAVAHRPLRYHPIYGGSRARLSPETAPLVAEWAELIKVEGIRSIISLMHDGDTDCYRGLSLGDGDLLTYLEEQGLVVARHPYEDPAHQAHAASPGSGAPASHPRGSPGEFRRAPQAGPHQLQRWPRPVRTRRGVPLRPATPSKRIL